MKPSSSRSRPFRAVFLITASLTIAACGTMKSRDVALADRLIPLDKVWWPFSQTVSACKELAKSDITGTGIVVSRGPSGTSVTAHGPSTSKLGVVAWLFSPLVLACNVVAWPVVEVVELVAGTGPANTFAVPEPTPASPQ
ncbi:MAG: hypothetical protein IPK26_24225 [Planctomycetes bacterium]|nr:hypothetical protein [Planctomycetota bacterium]